MISLRRQEDGVGKERIEKGTTIIYKGFRQKKENTLTAACGKDTHEQEEARERKGRTGSQLFRLQSPQIRDLEEESPLSFHEPIAGDVPFIRPLRLLIERSVAEVHDCTGYIGE